MRRLFFLITVTVLFLIAQSSGLLASEVSLTVEEAVAIALRDNRDVLLKSRDVEESKRKVAESQGPLFPALSFTGAWQDTQGLYSKDIGQTTTQLSLKQYLYKGGKTINTIKQSKSRVAASEAVLDKTRLDLILNVHKAFYTLLFAQEFVNLNKGIVDNTQQHLNVLKVQYKKGEVDQTELLRLQSSLENVKQAYEASLNQVKAGEALLKNLLCLDQGVTIAPRGEFTYGPREIVYDEAFLKALKTRPEIRQWEAQEKVDQKSIEIVKADTRPSIYASWDYYSRSHMSAVTTASKNWNDYNIFGFTFSWPVFDGWATRAKVEQAILDLKETQLTKEKTVQDIVLELQNAYLGLQNALAKLAATEADNKVYEDNLKVLKEKYKNGLASSLDLDDAQVSYRVSLFNKKQATYDYIIAKVSFEKATGGLQ